MKKYKKILLYILIILGTLGIADTLLIIPISSGISLGTLLPGIIGIFCISFAIINLMKKKPIFKSKALIRIIIALFCISIAFVLIIETLIIVEGSSKEAEHKEMNFVVVLGCGIFLDGGLTLTLKNRLDAAIEYLDRYPNSLCIVSGGQGPSEPYPEAFAMREYLTAQGIAESRILYEDKSTNTKENLLFSSQIISTSYPQKDKTLALVSSDFHMFRIKFLAKRFDIESIGIPCATPWYIRLNTYLREFVAVIKSFIFDIR